MKYIAPIVVFGLIGITASAFRGELFAGAPLFLLVFLMGLKPAAEREWLLYILVASTLFSLWNDVPLPKAFVLFSAVSLFAIFMRERLRPRAWREIIAGLGGIAIWWLGIFLWQALSGGQFGLGNIAANIFWAMLLFLIILMLVEVWRKLVPAHRQ